MIISFMYFMLKNRFITWYIYIYISLDNARKESMAHGDYFSSMQSSNEYITDIEHSLFMNILNYIIIIYSLRVFHIS